MIEFLHSCQDSNPETGKFDAGMVRVLGCSWIHASDAALGVPCKNVACHGVGEG